MDEVKYKSTETGGFPEDWEVAKIRKRYERTLGAMEKSASELENKVNNHLLKMGVEE